MTKNQMLEMARNFTDGINTDVLADSCSLDNIVNGISSIFECDYSDDEFSIYDELGSLMY